jgi:hypothetical protein
MQTPHYAAGWLVLRFTIRKAHANMKSENRSSVARDATSDDSCCIAG